MNHLLNIFLGKDFQISLWSNFLSDVFAAGVISILVYQFTSIFKRPRLSMVVKQGSLYSDNITAIKREDGDYEASFYLAIKNIGRNVLKEREGYWHIYIPNATDIQHTGIIDFSAAGENTHFRDLIQGPIFPDFILDLNLTFKVIIKKVDFEGTEIRYFFQTSYGNFPSSAKLNEKNGTVLYKDMSVIKFTKEI